MKAVKIFALSKSKELGDLITKELGLPLGKFNTQTFSDGETSVSFEESIREQKVYIVGSTHQPADNFVELLLAVDAARRAGAKKVNLVIPYYGWSRQDRRDKHRGAIGAATISKCLQAVGADSFMIVDLHCNQIEGFFDEPLAHIQGSAIFIPYLKKIIKGDEWVVCSPDKGGVERASIYSDAFKSPLVFINKKRDKANSIASMELIGDVAGKKVLLIDDLIDTGGSLSKATDLLIEKGATEVIACITHGVLSGKAYDVIGKSKLKNLYVSDTIPVPDKKGDLTLPSNIQIISSAPILARVIRAIADKGSISQLQKRSIE